MPRRRFNVGDLFGAVILLAVATALFTAVVHGVYMAREGGRDGECSSHLKAFAIAFHSYHDTYGAFPPAYVPDANGIPMHSWRVLILPFICENNMYQEYDFDEPWDGPNNRKLADKYKFHPELFQCQSRRHSKSSMITDYVVVVGKDTIFPDAKSRSMREVSDGLKNTILLVEINNSDIHWMEPRDLQFEAMSFVIDDPSSPSISSAHPEGPYVAIVGQGTMRMKGSALRRQTVRALLTASGGEPVFTDNLRRYDTHSRSWCLAEETHSNN